QVAEGAGEVALQDFALQVLAPAAAHRVDEVAEVIAAAVEGGDDLALLIEGHTAVVIRKNQVAVAAVEDVTDLRAGGIGGLHLEGIGRKAADLEDQLAFAVVEEDDLGVGGLAVVHIAEA